MGALIEQERLKILVVANTHPQDFSNVEYLIREAIDKIAEENDIHVQFEITRL